MRVIVTVFPLLEFVQAAGGEWVEAHLLIPPGAEIHSWQPRPSDVMKTANADMFVYIGAELEPWAERFLRIAGRNQWDILEASRGIDLIHGHNHSDKHTSHAAGIDPHIWLDFSIDQNIVDRIVAELSRLDPEHAGEFEANGKKYKRKLQRLDKKFREELEECQTRLLLLSGHSAFGYLARRYDLEQLSLYGLSPDEKPTPGHLVDLLKKAEKMDIRSIFIEAYNNDDTAEMLAEEIGAEIYTLNPGANLSRQERKTGVTFIDIMEKNLENLKNGLGCGR